MDDHSKQKMKAQRLIRVLRTARTLHAELPTQVLELFLHIAEAGDIAFRDLIDKADQSAPSVTRNIGAMSERAGDKVGYGLVEPYLELGNMRAKRVKLTPKGRRFFEALLAPLENTSGKGT